MTPTLHELRQANAVTLHHRQTDQLRAPLLPIKIRVDRDLKVDSLVARERPGDDGQRLRVPAQVIAQTLAEPIFIVIGGAKRLRPFKQSNQRPRELLWLRILHQTGRYSSHPTR